MSKKSTPPPGKGVRSLNLDDHLPDAEIRINQPVYDLSEVCKGKKVVDIGCGYGRNRKLVESVGGEWIGVEPFEGGAHTITASAEHLPFDDESFDVAIMDAVLEHIPDVGAAFAETARILRPGGCFVGYAAYMECFHEISYSHLSFKALEHYSNINGLKLEKISGARRFGIDYHLAVILYPLRIRWIRGLIASGIRGVFRCKSCAANLALRLKGCTRAEASRKARAYYRFECLRQSNGYNFLIRKPFDQSV